MKTRSVGTRTHPSISVFLLHVSVLKESSSSSPSNYVSNSVFLQCHFCNDGIVGYGMK